MNFNVKALYHALDAERETRALSWRQVADESGVATNSLFTRLQSGHRPDVDNLVRLTSWLGLPVEQFVDKPRLKKRKRSTTIVQISAALLEDPDLTPEQRKAILSICTAAYNQLKSL